MNLPTYPILGICAGAGPATFARIILLNRSFVQQRYMTFFKIVWGFDALVALVVIYFFIAGLSDGTVSGRNSQLWLLLLGLALAIPGGSAWLKMQQHPSAALILALVPAIPAFLYLLFIAAMIAGKVKWQ